MRFGIFIYDGVEPIDLATYGVLSMARRIAPNISICTIAPKAGVVNLSNGLQVLANYSIDNAPQCDVLIVTGGPGWETQAKMDATLDFIRSRTQGTRITSVCTGAMILAASGLLDGKRATTKREVVPPERPPIDVMRERHPAIDVGTATLIEDDTVITGGGVSLSIDTTLYIIECELGRHVADETARILEYKRARAANEREFPAIIARRPAPGRYSQFDPTRTEDETEHQVVRAQQRP